VERRVPVQRRCVDSVSDARKSRISRRSTHARFWSDSPPLPIRSWRYIAEPDGPRRIGPAAQDFGAAFGLGEDERTISMVDADGVALAAIQGLNAKLESKLAQVLTNPVYGGAYAYGKTACETHYEDGQARKSDRRRPREQWLALIPNAHEGYVEWERFERLQRTIRANLPLASSQPGAVRAGTALPAGLLRCRRCAAKLTVHYTGSHHDVARYACHRAWLDKASRAASALAVAGSTRRSRQRYCAWCNRPP
jgi:Recombinase